MPDEARLIAYKLIKDASLIDFEILKTDIRPNVDDDDKLAKIELQLEEEMVDTCGLGVMFTLCVLSFHDGRPRGASGHWYEDEDELSLSDFMEQLRYEEGKLRVYIDYLRGRCLKTGVTLHPDGRLVLETVNRGEAATRWVDRLQGKKFLRPSKPSSLRSSSRSVASTSAPTC